jgi:predicted NAD-dependent protein-ADP-ribosyltransferase YbiA (DUF1768 family)
MPSYTRSECVVFCKTDETFGAFSNMAGGFPLYLGGQYYSTSEHLYQCLRFPQYPRRPPQNPPPVTGSKSPTWRRRDEG